MNANRLGGWVIVLGMVGVAWSVRAAPVESEITYQGQLKMDGAPFDGTADFQFTLWDSAGSGNPPTGGTQVGGVQAINALSVTAGLFTVSLNAGGEFGGTAFDGDARWVQLAVRSPAGGGVFTILAPRQPLTATPYALYALDGPGGSGPWQTSGEDIFNTNVGNVGVGTNDTTHRLTVAAPDQETMRLLRSTTGYGEGARFNFGDSDYVFIEEDLDDRLQIQASRIALVGGNVGIGTTTPQHRLGISGGASWTSNFWSGALELDNASAIAWKSNAGGRRFGIGQSIGGLYFFHTSSDPGTTTNPADYDMVINDNGSVGIGTTTPAYPLTVRTADSLFVSGYGWVHTNDTVELGSYLSSTGGWLGTRSNHPLHFFTNDSGAHVTLTTSGGVGIGTSTVPAGVRLAVDGKILCEEMEVQLSGDWPDYVFDESYALMPLSELEETIKGQKHLPGIPSAADVAKDGVNVGQMQAQLVEKVEELTLYMIQMNKQLERVELENAELKSRLAALEGNP